MEFVLTSEVEGTSEQPPTPISRTESPSVATSEVTAKESAGYWGTGYVLPR